MKTIKLKGQRSKEEVWVNPEFIALIQHEKKGSKITMAVMGALPIMVEETPEEVVKLIQNLGLWRIVAERRDEARASG